MTNIARQYGLTVQSRDPKLKTLLASVNEGGKGGKGRSGAGGSDNRVVLLEAELDAAVTEIERLRRELAIARAVANLGPNEGKVRVRGEKPWEALGISRQTYWRRQKSKGGE